MRILQVGSRNQYETKVSDDDYNFLIRFKWTFGISHRHGACLCSPLHTLGRKETYNIIASRYT